MDKRVKYSKLIDQRIRWLVELVDGDGEMVEDELKQLPEMISDLETVLMTYGMSDENVMNMVLMILDVRNGKTLNNLLKTRMIRCLYPINPISNDVLVRIIGCIGINSPRKKSFIHKNLQVKLIRWLYLNISINNIANYDALKRLAPMILNLIDVEYVSQWVSLIIFKIITHFIDDYCFIRNLVKKWRLNLLIELNSKLNDPNLVVLIMLFQELISESKMSYQLKISNLIKDKGIASNFFKYPSLKYLDRLITIKTMNGASLTLDNEFIENLALSLQTFESYKSILNDRRKKLITDDNNYDLISVINSNENHFALTDLISNFQDLELPAQLGAIILKFANLKEKTIEIGDSLEIKTIDTGIHQYFFLVRNLVPELSNWCEVLLVNAGVLQVDDKNLKTVQKVFKGLTNIQMIFNVEFPICHKILKGEIVIETDTPINCFHWFEQLTLDDGIVSFLEGPWDQNIETACTTLRSLVVLLNKSQNYKVFPKVYSIVLRKVSQMLQKRVSISLEFETLQFLSTITKVPFSKIDLSNLIIPPTLMYQFLLSGNANIISDVCKHISFTKNYFAEYYSQLIKGDRNVEKLNGYKNLHNSYVMEICNLLWRDKLFEYRSNSSSKAMLLPESFVTKLQNMSMHIEDDLQVEHYFRKSFNVFLGPLFESTVIELLKKLEIVEGCEVHYTDIIDEVNFNSFIKGLEGRKWLQVKNFEEFKIVLLRELDRTEFNGVSGLLFGSLKSLLNMR